MLLFPTAESERNFAFGCVSFILLSAQWHLAMYYRLSYCCINFLNAYLTGQLCFPMCFNGLFLFFGDSMFMRRLRICLCDLASGAKFCLARVK